MGNNQSEINKKPYRWFEFKPYKLNKDEDDPDQTYYNSLIINKGYLIPLSIEQCANLEKQLNLNNEGLSTKYFFKYDYSDKFLTVKKNKNKYKRLKIPILQSKNIYKIKRLKRFSKNCFNLLNSNNNNYINDLKIFFYKDIFKDIKIDSTDKFILKFINHYALMKSDLIDTIKKILPEHLCVHHGLKNEIFNFEKIFYILVNDFRNYKTKQLFMYPKFFLYNFSKDNFDINMIKMLIEEGELINLVNKAYKENIYEPNILFYLLCLQFAFDNLCNDKENITCYKTIDINSNNFNKDDFVEGNLLMNFEYMSVTKDKNILNINNTNNFGINKNDDENINQTILEIEFEKPCIKNWYLSFKTLDTENISQYPVEREILIQPYSIFEVKEVKKLSNDNLYIKLYMRSNLLSKLSEYDNIPKQIQQNLGLLNNIGENIIEEYPNINLEQIVSITFNKKENIFKNEETLTQMKNIRILDMTNINLSDQNIKDLLPFFQNLIFLNYINISLNNLSHLSLEYLSEVFSSFEYIEHIILDQNSFGNEGIIALCQGLKKIENVNIRTFSGFYNQIKSEGIEKLSEELKRFKNLTYLNLSTNFIFYEEMDDFVYSIKYLTNLIELNLSNNQISSEGISYIGQILPKTIQKLNFSENEIYQDGFCDFGDYLNRIPNLTTLIIYGNRNGPSGVNSLLDGLENCVYLSYLDFGCTRIEDCDIVLILKKIRKIKNIKYLNIKENNLTDDCIYFLIQCIHILTNLETLDISWNSLEGNNLSELFGILIKLEKFKCINIEGNPCISQTSDINNLLGILNQKNINDKLWEFNKGKFIKKENNKTAEIFIKQYISEIKTK